MNPTLIAATKKRCEASPLSGDQWCQLLSFTRRTQPYLPFKDLAFVELIDICALYCNRVWWNENGPVDSLKRDLQKFKQKYYPYGFKINNKSLDSGQYKILYRLRSPRFRMAGGFPDPYNPMEKIAFVKTQRACYRWLTSLESEQSTDEFINKLGIIAMLIRK